MEEKKQSIVLWQPEVNHNIADFSQSVTHIIKQALGGKSSESGAVRRTGLWVKSWSVDFIFGTYLRCFDGIGVVVSWRDETFSAFIPTVFAFNCVFQVLPEEKWDECVVSSRRGRGRKTRDGEEGVRVVKQTRKVDFSEKRGILIAYSVKTMTEAWADDDDAPMKVGVCDGGTFQEQCVQPSARRQALHRVQEKYVCGRCADEWEKKSGRSSTQVTFTVRTTEIPKYSIYFSVERAS